MASSSLNRAATANPTVPTASIADIACFDNKVDFTINTDVMDFEMQGGAGITAGFSPTGGLLSNIDVNISYSEGQLQTVMQLNNALQPGTASLLNVSGSATKTNISFGVNFLVGLFSIGPSVYYSTTVADLSMAALQNNIANLAAALQGLSGLPWWQPITEMDSQKGFFIAAGSSAGIVDGQQFQVMDVTYDWGGNQTPCTNSLLMPFLNSSTPLATATVSQVTPTTAYMTINTATRPLTQYMYVTPAASAQPVAAPCTNFLGIGCPSTATSASTVPALAYGVRLGTLTAGPLVFTGQNNTSVTVDMTPFVSQQLSTILAPTAGSEFYLHQ